VGVAAEYAVKARETYEKVAEHGELTVRAWRGEAAEQIEDIAVAVEPSGEPKSEQKSAAGSEAVVVNDEPAEAKPAGTAKKAPAKKAPARKTAAKKATPPAE
jgi:hypothetical protein